VTKRKLILFDEKRELPKTPAEIAARLLIPGLIVSHKGLMEARERVAEALTNEVTVIE